MVINDDIYAIMRQLLTQIFINVMDLNTSDHRRSSITASKHYFYIVDGKRYPQELFLESSVIT